MVFADQFQQTLHDRLLARATAVNLGVNCRNTRPVAAYVNGLSGYGSVTVRAADGPDVQIEYYDTRADYLKKLRSTVNGIVGELDHGRLPPGDVVILTVDRTWIPAEVFAPGFFVRPATEARGPQVPGAIRISTVHAFKGLEASCVVLTGFSRIDTPEDRRLLYVGGSRARGLLYILLPKAAAPQVAASMQAIAAALTTAGRGGPDPIDL
jgi:hypothetical protein